jgi:hypothetical protein
MTNLGIFYGTLDVVGQNDINYILSITQIKWTILPNVHVSVNATQEEPTSYTFSSAVTLSVQKSTKLMLLRPVTLESIDYRLRWRDTNVALVNDKTSSYGIAQLVRTYIYS